MSRFSPRQPRTRRLWGQARAMVLALGLAACATFDGGKFEVGYRAYQDGDFATALDYWRPLAESGYALAQYNLGLMYAEGRGLDQDPAQAKAWLAKAAAQGVPEAAFNLAGFHLAGAEPDYRAARQLLEAAAEAGLSRAQHSLAKLHEYGLGGPKDPKQAHRYFSRAAAQGHLGAMYNLGKAYRDGRGVAADEALSIRWFRSAAEAGYAKGQAKLGDRYAEGRGVPQDDLEAYVWTALAARQGLPRADEKAAARKAKLSAARLSEAEGRIADFKPQTDLDWKTR